jgi:hypothetical protein
VFWSDVESEVHHFALAYNVFLTLETHLPGVAGTGRALAGDVIGKANHLRTDEAVFKIRMDDTGSLGRGRPRPERPSANFLRTGSEVGLQPKQIAGCTNYSIEARFLKTKRD